MELRDTAKTKIQQSTLTFSHNGGCYKKKFVVGIGNDNSVIGLIWEMYVSLWIIFYCHNSDDEKIYDQ